VPDGSGADPTGPIAGRLAVESALGRLSPGQRAVVVLRYWSNLSELEIADALGIAPGTVKSRLSRALSRLAADGDLAELEDPRRMP
jgi:DNA-directed RNA polymerase specialized sigma24 family protein